MTTLEVGARHVSQDIGLLHEDAAGILLRLERRWESGAGLIVDVVVVVIVEDSWVYS